MKIVETFGRSELRPEPKLGSSQRSPSPLAGGKGLLLPSPRTPPRSQVSASIFGPSDLIRQSPPSVFIPPMLRDLHKTRQRGPTCGEVERESDAVDPAVRAKRDLNSAARRAPRSRHVPTAQLPLGADRFPFRVQLHQLRHTHRHRCTSRRRKNPHSWGSLLFWFCQMLGRYDSSILCKHRKFGLGSGSIPTFFVL